MIRLHKHVWSFFPMDKGEEEHGVQQYRRFCLKCGIEQDFVYHRIGMVRYSWITRQTKRINKKKRKEFKAKLDLQLKELKELKELRESEGTTDNEI